MAKVFADNISLCTADQTLINYRRFAVIDSAGNNNGKLDRDETGNCILTLYCAAGAVANLTGTLQSLSPDLQIQQTNASFGSLSYGDTAANAAAQLVIRAKPTAPIETPIWCNLYLTGTGFAETLRVPILVGDSMCEPLGPDAYGYMAYDNGDITYSEHPTYDWVEISDIGEKLTLGDDATQTIDLPPEFGPIYYYGQRTTKLSVCSNGWVAPDTSTRLDFNNLQLPCTYAPQRVIALNWDNFDPTPFGWIGYYCDAANHRLIVEFDSVPYFPLYADWQKVEIIFYDTTLAGPSGDNVFVMQYATANNIGSITAGIQNNEGLSGLTYLYNSNYPRQSAPIVPGRAVKYVAIVPPTAVNETPATCALQRLPSLSVRPNPLSGQGFVSYDLPQSSRVKIGVYDVSGKLVRELVNGLSSAGAHMVDFQTSVLRIPPGVYFCRMRTDSGESALKLVLQ
jgi:hypothetical protein